MDWLVTQEVFDFLVFTVAVYICLLAIITRAPSWIDVMFVKVIPFIVGVLLIYIQARLG